MLEPAMRAFGCVYISRMMKLPQYQGGGGALTHRARLHFHVLSVVRQSRRQQAMCVALISVAQQVCLLLKPPRGHCA